MISPFSLVIISEWKELVSFRCIQRLAETFVNFMNLKLPVKYKLQNDFY